MSEEISREEIAALLARESEEMTNEEAIEVLQQDIPCEHDTDLIEAIDMAIKALEQEPCDVSDTNVGKIDAISRQAAIEKIHWLGLDHDTAIKCDLAIRALSPVTPKQRTGHWQDLTGLFFCSECDGGFAKPWRYCPNCGAKMEEQA